jgi:hypothetical protein
MDPAVGRAAGELAAPLLELDAASIHPGGTRTLRHADRHATSGDGNKASGKVRRCPSDERGCYCAP